MSHCPFVPLRPDFCHHLHGCGEQARKMVVGTHHARTRHYRRRQLPIFQAPNLMVHHCTATWSDLGTSPAKLQVLLPTVGSIQPQPHGLPRVAVSVGAHHGLSRLPAHGLRGVRQLWPRERRHLLPEPKPATQARLKLVQNLFKVWFLHRIIREIQRSGV